MFQRLIGDLRYALRTSIKAPTFTAAVVATIALAIGGTAAIFAVVNAVVLRPLPFAGSERAVALCETNPVTAGWCGASPKNVADWERLSGRLDAAGVARTESFIAHVDGGSFGVMGGITTPGFFDVLNVKPMLGRLIEGGDMPAGSNQVVVVSRDFWRRRLGADASVVGRSIVLDRRPFTIVGVLPGGGWMPDPFADVQIWKPLTASIDDVENRGWRGFTAIGRMAPGVSLDDLLTELSVVRAQLAAAYPVTNAEWGIRAVGLREKAVGEVGTTLWIFLAASAVVLLIACTNVAGLFLVRATGRAGEFAIRTALGAGRRRLVQQLMIESLLLTTVGGVFGLLLAGWVVSGFVAVAPASIPRLPEIGIDARVVCFVLAVAVAVAASFGIVPARRAWKADLNGPIKGLRVGTARDTHLRSVFAVVQLALALMLLFGAGLLTRSFARLSRWDPGFDRANVVTTWMLPPKTATPGATVALMERVREEVAGLPGVRAAALGSAGPLFGGEETGDLAIEGRPPFAADRMPSVQWFDIDGHYFEALGIRTIKGRGFTAGDTAASERVAIVNDTFARRFFPGDDAIGRRVVVHRHAAEIVGIVADVKPLRPDEATAPQIFWPIEQYPRGAAYLILRTGAGVAGIQKSIETRVAEVNADVQLNTFVTLDERLARRLVSPRFNMLLVAAFALVALALAAVGVYGVLASTVASRTREFGIRVALGASPHHLVRNVMRRGIVLALVGVGAGSAGALAAARLLASLLYGLPASDPLTLAAAIGALVVVSMLACWTPARRASRVDPVVALRAQ